MRCAQAQDIQPMPDIGPVQAIIQATVGQLPVQIFRLRLRPGAPACLRLLAGHPWVAQASAAFTGQRIAVRTMRKGAAVWVNVLAMLIRLGACGTRLDPGDGHALQGSGGEIMQTQAAPGQAHAPAVLTSGATLPPFQASSSMNVLSPFLAL